MLAVTSPYKRHGKLFFRCLSNGVIIYLTMWQISLRDARERVVSVTIPVNGSSQQKMH